MLEAVGLVNEMNDNGNLKRAFFKVIYIYWYHKVYVKVDYLQESAVYL